VVLEIQDIIEKIERSVTLALSFPYNYITTENNYGNSSTYNNNLRLAFIFAIISRFRNEFLYCSVLYSKNGSTEIHQKELPRVSKSINGMVHAYSRCPWTVYASMDVQNNSFLEIL